MNPATHAVLLSAFLFPGLGQLHQKRRLWGWLFIVLTVSALVMLGFPIVSLAHELATEMAAGSKSMDIGVIRAEVERRGLAGKGSLPALLLIGTWLVSALDAWLAGRRGQAQDAAGTRSRDRTGTPSLARDFKSRVSTSFTIRAARRILA